MSFYVARPTESEIHETFTPVTGSCPSCGASELRSYKVLRSRGWQVVERCRSCLHDVSATPAPQSYVPLTDGWPTSSAG